MEPYDNPLKITPENVRMTEEETRFYAPMSIILELACTMSDVPHKRIRRGDVARNPEMAAERHIWKKRYETINEELKNWPIDGYCCLLSHCNTDDLFEFSKKLIPGPTMDPGYKHYLELQAIDCHESYLEMQKCYERDRYSYTFLPVRRSSK